MAFLFFSTPSTSSRLPLPANDDNNDNSCRRIPFGDHPLKLERYRED